jgi:hypothetical protein
MQGLPEEVAAAFLKQNELDEHVCRLASCHPEPNPDPDPDPDPDPEPEPKPNQVFHFASALFDAQLNATRVARQRQVSK